MKFSDFNLTSPILNVLDELGYVAPTPIQEKCFTTVMSGRDVLGIAQTGTGKTLAYLLPIVRLIEYTKIKYPKVLILVPTRELVKQVEAVAIPLAASKSLTVAGVYGGVNLKPQAEKVKAGVDIIIGTPGRVYDLINNGYVATKHIKKLVVDEVDEMLNLGFRAQLNRIFDNLPDQRQSLLFSATLDPEIDKILNEYFISPEKIEAAPAGTTVSKVDQYLYNVPNFYTKVNLLKYLLSKNLFDKSIIFVSSKKRAEKLYQELDFRDQEEIGIIHSNKEQSHRFRTIEQLRDGDIKALIATDIVARGIDIDNIDYVVNFDLPDMAEYYVHRIGRTGRVEQEGIAMSFVTEKDAEYLENIETLIQKKIEEKPLPEEVELDERLLFEEMPVVVHKEIQLKIKKRENVGASFHEKKDKNKPREQKKESHKEKMMKKYGKPKTRGAKGKKR